MRFSLIMCTVGRIEEPEELLASLQKQTFRDFEVIVSDQNPDSRLVPVLAAHEDSFPILHLRLESKGASKARNEGMKHAKGDILAFPDDDCLYPPDLLEKGDSFFSANPGEDGLTGRSVDMHGETSMGRFDPEAGSVNRLNLWTRGIEYTMFLKRESVGGLRFDEEIGAGAGTPWGSGEATDFLMRFMEKSSSLYYDPTLTVVHSPAVPPYTDDRIRKAYEYGSGMGLMLKRYNMPLRMKARWLYRPLGEAVRTLASRKPSKAHYYWSTFKGRLRGLS